MAALGTSGSGMPARRRWANGMRAAALGAALAVLPPVASHAAAPDAGAAAAQVPAGSQADGRAQAPGGSRALMIDMPHQVLTPGMPPPRFTTVSDRRIVTGGILLLLAGLGGLTALMWRELGARIRSS